MCGGEKRVIRGGFRGRARRGRREATTRERECGEERGMVIDDGGVNEFVGDYVCEWVLCGDGGGFVRGDGDGGRLDRRRVSIRGRVDKRNGVFFGVYGV